MELDGVYHRFLLERLKELQRSGDVRAVTLVSGDGSILLSNSWQIANEDQIARIATLLASASVLGENLADEIVSSKLQYLFFECGQDGILAAPLADENVLVVLTPRIPKLGFILNEIRRIFWSSAYDPIFGWQPPGHLKAGADFD